MGTMRIAYLGYDILSPCLRALEESGCSVMKVFSFPTDDEFEFSREVEAFARERGLPFTRERITLREIHNLKAQGCEAIFSAGYPYRVPIDHSLPIVNVHPSLLPVGRGGWPMPVTILRGLKESGVTLHKMEADFDTGDILLQESFPVGPEDTLETMTEQIRVISARLCRNMAADFSALWAAGRPQGAGEYWPCPRKPDYTIRETTPPQETARVLRAFFGYDCYLKTEAAEYRIVRGLFRPQEHSLPVGPAGVREDGTPIYAVRGGFIEVQAEERSV